MASKGNDPMDSNQDKTGEPDSGDDNSGQADSDDTGTDDQPDDSDSDDTSADGQPDDSGSDDTSTDDQPDDSTSDDTAPTISRMIPVRTTLAPTISRMIPVRTTPALTISRMISTSDDTSTDEQPDDSTSDDTSTDDQPDDSTSDDTSTDDQPDDSTSDDTSTDEQPDDSTSDDTSTDEQPDDSTSDDTSTDEQPDDSTSDDTSTDNQPDDSTSDDTSTDEQPDDSTSDDSTGAPQFGSGSDGSDVPPSSLDAANKDADTNFGNQPAGDPVAPCDSGTAVPLQTPPPAGGTKPPPGPVPGNLEVTVTDSKTGKIIPAAKVTVAGPETPNGPTNDQGKITFTGIKTGDYTATATADGYTTETGSSVTVPPASTGKTEVKLKPVTVTIALAAAVACPGHPLEITATGDPGGGTYAWTITGDAGVDLVDAAGATVRTGNKVNLRGFEADPANGNIIAKTSSVSVTYTYTNGSKAKADQSVKIHEIKFAVTNKAITAGFVIANEIAAGVVLGVNGVAEMSTDPKVEIRLDSTCPRKADCAANHRVGWLQTVRTNVRQARYTHSLVDTTVPLPIATSGMEPCFRFTLRLQLSRVIKTSRRRTMKTARLSRPAGLIPGPQQQQYQPPLPRRRPKTCSYEVSTFRTVSRRGWWFRISSGRVTTFRDPLHIREISTGRWS